MRSEIMPINPAKLAYLSFEQAFLQALYMLIYLNAAANPGDTLDLFLFLKVKKMRHSQGKYFAQSHTTSDKNPRSLATESGFLTTAAFCRLARKKIQNLAQ